MFLNGRRDSRFILELRWLWVAVGGCGYLPLGVLKGMDFKAETCYSSKIMWPLNKRLSSFSTKPLPLECMGSRQQNPEWLYGNRSRLYFVFILHYRVFHINIACS